MLFEDLPLFSLDEAERYTRYYEMSGTELADAAPNSRFAWNPGYRYRYLILEDCYCLISDGGLFCQPHFSLPLGELNAGRLERITARMRAIFHEKGWALRAMFIDEEAVALFDALEGYEKSWLQNDDLSDYLYDASDLRELKGRKYRSKRNHVNRFMRSYHSFEYRSIRESDREAALELLTEWCQEKHVDCSDPNESDFLPIRSLFDSMSALRVRGGCILVDGALRAFTMGSLVHGDRAVIHFEKAHPDFEGIYTAINQFALQNDFAEAVLVNREEDMGLEGIRTAKMSYLPFRMIKKYEVVLRSPDGCLGA